MYNGKDFLLEEKTEIKEYGAVYVTNGGKNFKLSNDKNYKNGKKIVELNFQKTLFQKG